MIYLSWVAHCEGASDRAYFEVLIPRALQGAFEKRSPLQKIEIPEMQAVRLAGRVIDEVAQQACKAKDAFQIIFVHSDTGGRSLEANMGARSCALCLAMERRCEWPPRRCVVIAPRHETEAWILSDGAAVTSALGYTGSPESIGLPSEPRAAERLKDPKLNLHEAVIKVRGSRRRSDDVQQLYASIAQRQSLDQLRRLSSFAAFESQLIDALVEMRCVSNASD
ncbi:DUF4276 family protein [Methylosinus sporium]|uniref:DUF4276 family protein n=1 Tax=Methylosinus sporium TaxID=428 RepID=A0A549SPP7_METSR|nr:MULTISPECIES: DUF4276 family protein [Methylosinus]MBU3889435.1 DUF4276 family protein [Methylosinus sp. KRF6]TRL31612.1 DUF4276 family protein [Methylosinus sporium]